MSRLYYYYHYYGLVWVHAFLLVATVRGAPCNTGEHIAISAGGGMLYSLNYPLNYADGLTCEWTLTASANSKVVQLETVDIDVESPDERCTGDYLAAYDGSNAQATLLKKWCRTDKAVVTSTGPSLFLKFSSNPEVTRKGFSIAYREITPFDASCKDGQLTTLTVGSTPTLYTLRHPKTNIRECQWKFVAQGSNHMTLTVEMATGVIVCWRGYLSLHDGADASAPEILHWCRNNANKPPPFSAFYPSGAATIVLHVKDLSKVQSLDFQLSVKAHTRVPACLPIEVEKFAAPVFLSMPYTSTPGGDSCPAKVRPANADDTAFRVDVVKVDNQAVPCGSSGVSVYLGNKVDAAKALDSECWNNSRPMFLAKAYGEVTVTTQAGKTSVVQIVATSTTCAGRVTQYIGIRQAQEIQLPNKLHGNYGYTHFCVIRLVVEAKDAKQHPRIIIASHFTENYNIPSTLRVYDGANTTSPVLHNLSGPSLKYQFIGTGQNILVELSTTGLEAIDSAEVMYSQVPETTLCNTVHFVSLTATSQKQNLTSVNYPNNYPSYFSCRYTIRTDTAGEVVHLKVVEASFGTLCDDYLVVSARKSFNVKDRLGYVCAGNPNFPKSMQSPYEELNLQFFSSNLYYTIGSWKVEYFSAPPTPSTGDHTNDNDDDDDNSAAVVGAVLGVIIAILIIVIVVLVLRMKRRGNGSL